MIFKRIYKKLAVPSLLLFLVGVTGFCWVLDEREKEKETLQEHVIILNMLNAELTDSNKPYLDESDVYSYADDDVVPDDILKQKLTKHQSQSEKRELVYCASLALMAIGGTIIVSRLLAGIACMVLTVLPRLRNVLVKALRLLRTADDNQTAEIETRSDETDEQLKPKEADQESESGKYSQILESCGWQNIDNTCSQSPKESTSQAGTRASAKSCFEEDDRQGGKIATLYSSESAVATEDALSEQARQADTKPFNELAQNIRKTILSDYHENTQKLEDSLKNQAESLEKQICEFKQITQSVKETAIEHSKPLNNTIESLAQQISAIREYASYQQDRIAKLQDGYDWKIIKTFCLRVIRCIDNIEKRMELAQQKDSDTTKIEEIRDELVFALESSGIEQFAPRINSEYKGQEKSVEVFKQKEHCDDPAMKGKIAKIIRPGYRYVLDETNFRVVRTAQVKIFG